MSADTTPPGVRLGGKLRQKVVRRTLRITATPTEDVRVTVSGKVMIARSKTFALGRVKARELRRGLTTTLAIPVPRRALAAIKAALRRRKAVTAEITIIAKDAAGNAITIRRKIKVIGVSSIRAGR